MFAGVEFAGVEPVAVTPFTPFFLLYSLEVDWDGDTLFENPYCNVSEALDEMQYYVGRDYASQLQGRSSAGRLQAHLLNDEGIYSPSNASSPIAGLMLPGRRVRARSVTGDTTLWTGFTASAPKALAAVGSPPTASIEAVGPFALLANSNLKINPPLMRNVRSGAVINMILDLAGWPAANRIIDDGDMIIGAWFPQNIGVMEALQQIEEAEGGFLREGRNWDIVFESRYHRIYDALSATSQATFSDAAASELPYDQIEQDYTLREIVNRAEVPATTYVHDEVPILLASLGATSLMAGQTVEMLVRYAEGVAFVDPTEPMLIEAVVQPDSISASIVATLEPLATSVKVTLTNTHGSLAMSVTAGIYGYGWRITNELRVVREDLPSQDAYQLRTYPFSSPWFSSLAQAEAQAQWAIDRYKDPHPVLRLGYPALPTTMFVQTLLREISDRVTVEAESWQTQFGISSDFYIEGMGLELRALAIPRYTMILSEALPDPGYARFDVDDFDGGTGSFAY